jgi:hypothetical protein
MEFIILAGCSTRQLEFVAPNYVLTLTHSIHIQMEISKSIYPHMMLDIYSFGSDHVAIRSSRPSCTAVCSGSHHTFADTRDALGRNNSVEGLKTSAEDQFGPLAEVQTHRSTLLETDTQLWQFHQRSTDARSDHRLTG